MEVKGLGTWKPSERTMLARHLRRTVRPSTGREEILWSDLLRRLEQELQVLTTKDALELLNLTANPELLPKPASLLREKVREAGMIFAPGLGVFLTREPYEIQVKGDPPEGWKQSVGPSIGLLLADAADGFVGELIQGVSEVCNSHGYDLVVDVSSDDPIVEAQKLRRLLERTHGVLMVPVSDATLDPASREMLQYHDCVLVDRYLRDLPDVPCVHPDDISAGRRAGIYLKEHRCTAVLIVDQASRSPNSFAITPLEDRTKGCQIELRGNVPVRHLLAVGSDEQGGFDALEQFEKKQRLVASDGIFALTDRLAVGCRHYLATMRPELDLPLISTEGHPFGDFMNPPLVSIKFNDVETGRLAAKVLFAKLQEADLPHSDCEPHYLISPTLLVPSTTTSGRDSVAISFPDAASYYRR